MLQLKAVTNQKGIAPILILVAIVGVVAFLVISFSVPFRNSLFSSLFPKEQSQAAATSFYEPFTGAPSTPTAFNNKSADAANWDIVVNDADSGAVGSSLTSGFDQLEGHHGPGCEPPVTNDTPSALLVTHHINSIYDAVFKCKDHIMTSLLSGYALAVMTPNHMIDLSQGEAVIKFDLTSLRTSGRDWVDLWITPMEESFVLPIENWLPTYSGEPKNAVHIRADGNNDGSYHFEGAIMRNFTTEEMDNNAGPTIYGGVKMAFANSGAVKTVTINGVPTTIPVTQSPKRRDTYELRLSKTHAKFCLVTVNVQQEDATKTPVQTEQCWVNSNFADLGWDKAIVQFGHHAYNPEKDCSPTPLTVPAIDQGCRAVTWHWDEVKMSPTIPFTIIKPTVSSPDFITRDMSITLNSPTPPNSYLKFAAVAGNVDVSFDNGLTWTNIPKKQQVKDKAEQFSNYWGAIPAGVTTIKFRGANAAGWLARFVVQHVAVYSTDQNPLPTLAPTPTPTPIPTGPITVDFNNFPQATLTGQNPSGLINWDNTSWDVVAPWKGLTTRNLGFRSQSITSGTFTLMQPRTIQSIQAYNGGTVASNVTLSCVGNPDKTVSVGVDQLATITTGWTNPCTTVTLSSSNGWNTNFDNLSLGATTSAQTPPPTVQPSTQPSTTPSSKIGDINGNGKVDLLDYNILLTDFGKTGTNLRGDIYKTGSSLNKVDLFDYNLLLTNFGK